jgi:hypothetical protein
MHSFFLKLSEVEYCDSVLATLLSSAAANFRTTLTDLVG